MPLLDPPPNMPTLVWPKLKDWLYKLWTLVKGLTANLTFGGDAGTYSAAIQSTAGQSDVGSITQSFNQYPIVMAANKQSGQSLPGGAATVVTGWTTEVDTASAFSASTGVYTIPVGGVYLIQSGLLLNGASWNNTIGYGVRILKNGTFTAGAFRQVTATATIDNYANITAVFNCVAGDTISTAIANGTGGAILLYNNAVDDKAYNRFYIVRVA